jgi:hypothetical protein
VPAIEAIGNCIISLAASHPFMIDLKRVFLRMRNPEIKFLGCWYPCTLFAASWHPLVGPLRFLKRSARLRPVRLDYLLVDGTWVSLLAAAPRRRGRFPAELMDDIGE